MDLTGDNAELISRLRMGDPASWDDLRSAIRRLVLPRVLDARAPDREEILTDVTTALWLSLSSLRDGNSLLAFATTIARSVVARRLEGQRRHPLREADRALFKLLHVSRASSEGKDPGDTPSRG